MELDAPGWFDVRYREAVAAAGAGVADDTEGAGGVKQSIKQYVRDALRMGMPEPKLISELVEVFETTAPRAKGHVVYQRNKMLEDGELGDEYELPTGAKNIANRQWIAVCDCGTKVKSNGDEGKCRKCKTVVKRPFANA